MTEITGARLRQDFQNRIDGVRARASCRRILMQSGRPRTLRAALANVWPGRRSV